MTLDRLHPTAHMLVVLIQVLLAVTAFFVVNWLGRHAMSSGYYQISFITESDDAPAFNSVFRILAPLVFSVISASLLYAARLDYLVVDFYRVTVFYFAFRWGFNLVLGRGKLLLWPRQIFIAATSISLSYLLYYRVLQFRQNVLPDPGNLANELWVIILLFLYATFNKVVWPFGATAAQRRREYIQVQYRKYDAKYGAIIRRIAPNRFAEAVGFAILIYESFNRPTVYQWIERVMHKFGLSNSLGPMQVQSEQPINNVESVELGMQKVVAHLPLAEATTRKIYRYMLAAPNAPLPKSIYGSLAIQVATEYNVRSDYPHEVRGIYEELVELFYPDLQEPASGAEAVG